MTTIPTYIVNNDFDYLKPLIRTQPRIYWLEIYERLRLLAMMIERLQRPEDITQVAIKTDDVTVDSSITLPIEILARIVYVQKYGMPCEDEDYDPTLLEDIVIELNLEMGEPNLLDQSNGISFADPDTEFLPGQTVYAEHTY